MREIFDIFDSPSQQQDSDGLEAGKMVLIGRHLDSFDFRKSLEDTLGGAKPV